MQVVKGFCKDEEGTTMVEYAFMLGLIAATCILAVALVGSGTRGLFQKAVDLFPSP